MSHPLHNPVSANPHSVIRTPWRWAMAAIGVVCFALGGVGAVVPGMPTTVFLLLGSYFLVRSCPWLEDRLLTSRLFRPYAQFIRSREPMSTKARVAAITAMSISVAASLAALALTDKLTPVIAIVIATLWLVGFVAIMLFRRPAAIKNKP
ncbi:MAG TPA: YbaN family protein [Phycisphaerales bacterium]|nr:YbaN family protein [Phycisphaerales bacterium]